MSSAQDTPLSQPPRTPGKYRACIEPGVLGLCVLVFLALCWNFLHIWYITNDNFAIIDLARHGYTVRYFGAPLSSLLHLLYTAAPGTAWFPLLLYAAHAVSLFLWLWLLSRVCRPRWLQIAVSLVVLAFYARCLISLDYTSTAVMLCASSLTWLAVEISDGSARYGRYLGAGVIFGFALLIRPQVPLGMLAYSTALAVWVATRCLSAGGLRAEGRRLALIGIMFLAPLAAVQAVDSGWRQVNRTPLQAQYESFNKLRGQIHRLSRSRKAALMRNPAALRSVHWTRRDLAYLYNWYFLDERVYTPQALQTLLDAAPPPKVSWRSVFKTFDTRLDRHNPYVLLMLASVPLFLALLRRSWMYAIGALTPLWPLGVTAAMILLFGLLPRVEFPFELGCGLMGLTLALQSLQQAGDLRHGRLALACGLALALFGGYKAALLTYHEYQKGLTAAHKAEVEINILNQDFAGATVVLQSRPGFLETLDAVRPFSMRFNLIELGWTTYSPKFYDDLHGLGVDQPHQLVDALISRHDTYLLGLAGWPQKLLVYSERSDKHEIKVQVLNRFPNGTALSRYEVPDPGTARR